MFCVCFFSSRRRQTRCALVTGVQTCALPILTIPRDEYDRLREAAEDLVDLRAYDRAKADLASGRDELVPSDYADRILEGESPLRVWRDLRDRKSTRLNSCP